MVCLLDAAHLQLFPRHVIEHLSTGFQPPTGNLGHLARSHSEVSVVFLDIVGKCPIRVWHGDSPSY